MITLLLVINPNLVFTRAKVVKLSFLIFLSKIFNFKLVHMLASDDDVLVNNKIGKTKFQKAIDKIDYIIAQNHIQKDYYNQSSNPNQSFFRTFPLANDNIQIFITNLYLKYY
jgi:hypothetical protein